MTLSDSRHALLIFWNSVVRLAPSPPTFYRQRRMVVAIRALWIFCKCSEILSEIEWWTRPIRLDDIDASKQIDIY